MKNLILVGLLVLAKIGGAATPSVHVTNSGACLLVGTEVKCWGEEFLSDFSRQLSRNRTIQLKQNITNNVITIQDIESIASDGVGICLKGTGQPLFCVSANISDDAYRRSPSDFKFHGHAYCSRSADKQSVRCVNAYGNTSTWTSSEIHGYSLRADQHACVTQGEEKQIECKQGGTVTTPWAFTDLVGVEDITLGGLNNDPTACIIWGEDRKLICHRLSDTIASFPRLTGVHEVFAMTDQGFCAVYGPRREVECFATTGVAAPPTCNLPDQTYLPLVGKMAVEKVVSISANAVSNFQQVCVLVENDPIPYCWMYGCGVAKHFKTHGWTNRVLPDWHPRYGKGGFAHFQGEFSAGAPLIKTRPPGATPAVSAPAGGPTPSAGSN